MWKIFETQIFETQNCLQIRGRTEIYTVNNMEIFQKKNVCRYDEEQRDILYIIWKIFKI